MAITRNFGFNDDVECKSDNTEHEHEFRNKYDRLVCNHRGQEIVVDVYDVLLGFNVTCPIMSHLAKKALAVGERGHKDKLTDLHDIKTAILRAIEEEERKQLTNIDTTYFLIVFFLILRAIEEEERKQLKNK